MFDYLAILHAKWQTLHNTIQNIETKLEIFFFRLQPPFPPFICLH